MEELIKITEHEGKEAVSARELHAYLEIGTRFDNWIKRMFAYGFNENVDYISCPFLDSYNQIVTDYVITLDCAKEISMIQRSKKGKQARQYFIACEKKLKEIIEKQLHQANEHHKLRYKKSIRIKEIDRHINELMRERKHLVKEINHIDRTSLIFLDLFEDAEENLYFGGFPSRRIG